MRENEFDVNMTGTLVLTPFNVRAFIPHALPPKIDLAPLTMPLAEAMQCIGELKGASRRLTNPYILVRPLQRQEALTSSAMEGTFTTDDELVLAEAGLEEQSNSAAREVRNYLSALQNSLISLQEDGLPISHRMLKQAHKTLLSGVGSKRGAHKKPGEYKTEQNAIGGNRIETARFIPPPPSETQKCMDKLEAYINRPDLEYEPQAQALIDIALVHYQLETIHPFADGNGRVGRMLISLMAVERNLFDMPLLYVSPALENSKDEYIDLMFNVSAKGQWTEWIIFFLKKVCETAQQTIRTIDRLIELQDEYRSSVSDMRTANGIKMIDYLFETPFLSIPIASNVLGITYRPAKNIIDRLVDLDVLTEISDSHPKLYIARKIITIAATETRS